MNDPGSDTSTGDAPAQRAGASATVPEEAFSPEGLAAHLARTGPTAAAIRLPDPNAATTPLLERPSLADRLRHLGRRALEPPQLRFEVERVLGMGATGRVFAVRDRNLQRAVAVKFLGDGQRPSEPLEIDHFIDEAQITASLEHPNVLPVHELDVNDAGQVFFTMKKIDGHSLGALIEQSTWDQRAAPIADSNAVVSLIIGVCQALAYAHDRGIVHQDVKPENIMLGDYGEVLLVDWGSAVRMRAGDKPRLYGTPLYMSPEQARTEGVDERSDIYCLGATLFHALTLRCPTWSDDAERFWRMKRAGEIQAPTAVERAAVPAPLLDIALKALAADPAQRYASAAQMLADLRSYQAGLAVIAHRDSWLEIVARWHRRHWRALWGTTVIATVVLGLAAMLYGERLKEIATWGQPLLAERFADDGWTERWQLSEGSFVRRDGALVSTGGKASSLLYPHRLWGPVAIEYDGEILPGEQPGDISVLWARDLDSANPQKPVDAYRFQVGAYDGAYSAICSSAYRHLASDYFRPEPGRSYRIRAEIDDYQLTLMVDGRVICRWTDTVRFDGGYLGLYAYYKGKAFRDVRIYSRGVAQKVPATAIGDAFMRLHQHDEAFAQYQRVTDSHPGTAIAREAMHKEGLCRWEQGRHAEALALWRGLAGTEYEPLVRLYAIDERFASGDHLGVLTDLEALYRVVDADLRKRVAMQWGRFLDQLRDAKDRAGLKSYLEFHDRVFPHEQVVDVNAADALAFLRRFDELLERYPGQRRQCAWSLIDSGRPHEVVERYRDQLAAYGTACFVTGEFTLWDHRENDLHDLVLVKGGRAEEVLAHPSRDDYAMFAALCVVGRLDEAIEHSGDEGRRGLALCLAGRPAEVLPTADRELSAVAHLQLGDAQTALSEADPGNHRQVEAQLMLGLQALGKGDEEQARRWFAKPLSADPWANEAFLHDCVAPWLLSGGDAAAFTRASAVAVKERWDDAQRIWYMASYVRGEMDDATFLAQPIRIGVDARLLLYRGFRREREGRPAEALADYRAYDALPLWRRGNDLDPAGDLFARWRSERLGAPAP